MPFKLLPFASAFACTSTCSAIRFNSSAESVLVTKLVINRRVASETRRLAAHSSLRGSLVSGVAKGSNDSDIHSYLINK